MVKMILLDTAKIPVKQVEALRQELKQYGSLVDYPITPPDELAIRCMNQEVILVNKNILLDEEQFKQLTTVKYIIVIATGYDNVNVKLAQQYGIKVSNIPDYSTITVAQHTFALLLELSNHVGYFDTLVKQGKWHARDEIYELNGLTLGVFGFGKIAQRVISIAHALGMNILVCGTKPSYLTTLPVQFVDRNTLLRTSDVISLHCPLTTVTKAMINQESIALMKPHTLLINTARGGLINEDDLYQALVTKRIAGAALDVFNIEPIAHDNLLLTLDNCIVSPHIAWLSATSSKRWVDAICTCVAGHISGNYLNLLLPDQ